MRGSYYCQFGGSHPNNIQCRGWKYPLALLNMNSRKFYWMGCLAEGGLFFLGAGLCWLFGDGLFSDFHRNGSDVLWGVAAVVPLWGVFLWTSRSSWRPLAEIREFLIREARPMFKDLGWGRLLLLSGLAGLGEEFFFRGAVQGGLSVLVGVGPALILSSLVFGLFHPITWGYLVLTSLIGLYLGGLWLVTENLLAPVVAHALYDFLALRHYSARYWRSMDREADEDRG